MVEGPQSTYMANWIRKKFKNHVLENIQIVSGRYKKHGKPKRFLSFKSQLPMKLTNVSKKGKVLFLTFENQWTIIVKFGMTAWFSMEEETPNVIFEFKDSNLYFKDLRQFGTLTFTNDQKVVQKELDKIAPDILESVDYQDIQKRIERVGTKTLDVILMDQKLVVSGIGNIIKSEILYDSKISPMRKAKDVSKEEWKRIFHSAKKICKKVLSNLIKNKDEFQGVIRVYEMEKDPKGNPVSEYRSKDGRSTYWVPAIQK